MRFKKLIRRIEKQLASEAEDMIVVAIVKYGTKQEMKIAKEHLVEHYLKQGGSPIASFIFWTKENQAESKIIDRLNAKGVEELKTLIMDKSKDLTAVQKTCADSEWVFAC